MQDQCVLGEQRAESVRRQHVVHKRPVAHAPGARGSPPLASHARGQDGFCPAGATPWGLHGLRHARGFRWSSALVIPRPPPTPAPSPGSGAPQPVPGPQELLGGADAGRRPSAGQLPGYEHDRVPSFPTSAVPRPLPRRTRETAPDPIPRGLSRPCAAALRLAARRSSGLPAAPPARRGRGVATGEGGKGGGVKSGFIFPIRRETAVSKA
jgi:hypothetical protein